jgi:hypothetical protein
LALVYVGLFSAAIFGLLAYVYWSTVSHLDRRVERAVDAEQVLLTRAYDQGGRRAVVALIDKRVGDQRLGGWYYGLFDASLASLSGNLRRWPEGAPLRSERDRTPPFQEPVRRNAGDNTGGCPGDLPHSLERRSPAARARGRGA